MNLINLDNLILHYRPRILSKQRLNVLRVLHHYQERVGYSPTVRELAGHLSLASHASVYAHLDVLRTEGMLSSTKGQPRSWRVTAKGRQALARTGGLPESGATAA